MSLFHKNHAFLLAWATSFVLHAAAYDASICGKNGWTSPSSNFQYNSNAWNSENGGFQCMFIHDTKPSYDATWIWPVTGSNSSSVHSFPYVRFANDQLPVALSNTSSLQLVADWSMVVGNAQNTDTVATGKFDGSSLSEKANTKANVAFDIFLDLDPANAGTSTTASTEIMVWLATVGGATALGYAANRTCFSQTAGKLDFVLYTGTNARGLDVYTWVAQANHTSFNMDVSPLLQYLWRNGLISSDLSVGLVEFGSETYYSSSNVTFSAANFNMTVSVGTAPQLDVSALPTSCSSDGSRYVTNYNAWLLASVCIAIACLYGH